MRIVDLSKVCTIVRPTYPLPTSVWGLPRQERRHETEVIVEPLFPLSPEMHREWCSKCLSLFLSEPWDASQMFGDVDLPQPARARALVGAVH